MFGAAGHTSQISMQVLRTVSRQNNLSCQIGDIKQNEFGTVLKRCTNKYYSDLLRDFYGDRRRVLIVILVTCTVSYSNSKDEHESLRAWNISIRFVNNNNNNNNNTTTTQSLFYVLFAFLKIGRKSSRQIKNYVPIGNNGIGMV
jgi:hypothetical protein